MACGTLEVLPARRLRALGHLGTASLRSPAVTKAPPHSASGLPAVSHIRLLSSTLDRGYARPSAT
jgi:hypothetical protein